MFTTSLHLWRIFRRKFLVEKRRYFIPSHITLSNLIPIDKRNYLKGTISIGHCRGHDCIKLVFIFDGFYDNHRRLLSENFYFR